MALFEYTNNNEDLTNDSNEVLVTIKLDKLIQFPINPEVIKNDIESNSLSEKIEGLGEISIPQTPSLSTMNFSSFFPDTTDESKKPSLYVKWIKDWQISKKPARFIVSGLNWEGWDMDVTCESFSYWTNAGEENDIYFTISLKEYRPYEAKEVKLNNKQFIIDEDGMTRVLANYDYSLYYEFNSGIKNRINNKVIPDFVYTGEDESILSVTKRYTTPYKSPSMQSFSFINYEADEKNIINKIEGMGLYEQNKSAIAESLAKQRDAMRYSTNFITEQLKLTDDYGTIKKNAEDLIRYLNGNV